QNRMALGHFFENIPDLGRLAFDHLLRASDRVNISQFLQATNDERLEEYERHFLGQSALVKLEFRTNHNDGATGVIDALSKKVLTKPATFALEHVAQGFQRTIARTCNSAPMAAIVEQRVDRLLKHPLFVA